MSENKKARLRRARRSRIKIKELGSLRLSVNRTPKHIYAQIISAAGDKVIVSASTLDKNLRKNSTGNVEAAKSHYVEWGLSEGRTITFDAAQYLSPQ